MDRRKTLSVLVSTVLTVGALAACGSSKPSTSTGTTTKSGLTGSPLDLVVITGITSSDPQPQDGWGATAAADAINASGGVQGHPVSVSVCDAPSETDPSASMACARNIVSNPNAMAEVGDLNTFQQQANAILLAGGVANIGPQPDSASVLSSSNSFPLSGLEAAAGATVLADAGAQKVSVAYADVAAAAAAVQFNQYALQVGRGEKLDGGIPVPLTATDMTPYVTKAATGDGVTLAIAPNTVQSWIETTRQLNETTKISVSATAMQPDEIAALGSKANGIIIAAGLPVVTSSNPGVVMFRQEMAKYEPGKFLDEVGLNSWLATWTFAQVARGISGPITKPSVLHAMQNLTNFNVFGMLPPGFSTTKQFSLPGLNRVFNTEIIEAVVENGQIKQTSPGYLPIFTKP